MSEDSKNSDRWWSCYLQHDPTQPYFQRSTKDTKDLGINSLTPNFVLFAIFVVKTQGSTLVAALPRWGASW